jgi:nicotinate-nucleotide adenylyltransferase
VLELARLAVAPRDGYPEVGLEFLAAHFPDLSDRAIFLDGPRIRLSASVLRDRAAAGRSLRYLVPDAVAAYIGHHGLYLSPRRNDQT